MKLFPAKCHERATLRKLWRQTGNSSLLPAKCWPPWHVIAGISAWFSNFAFVLFCYITNHLMIGPLGNSEFCFPRISMFPSTSFRETLRFLGNKIHCSSRETLRFSGNKIHCSPRDQSLSVKYLPMLCHVSHTVSPGYLLTADPHGEERKRNKTAVKLKQVQYICPMFRFEQQTFYGG